MATKSSLSLCLRWKGENVATTEVSEVLGLLEFIQEANVYGVTVPGLCTRTFRWLAPILKTRSLLASFPLRRVRRPCRNGCRRSKAGPSPGRETALRASSELAPCVRVAALPEDTGQASVRGHVRGCSRAVRLNSSFVSRILWTSPKPSSNRKASWCRRLLTRALCRIRSISSRLPSRILPP